MPVNTGADAYEEQLMKYNGGFLALHEYQSLQEELTLMPETAKTRKFAVLQTILKAARSKINSARHISNVQNEYKSHRTVEFDGRRLRTCFLEYEKQFRGVRTEEVRRLEQQCEIMEEDGSMTERKFVDEAWENLKMAILKYERKMKIMNASTKELLSHEEICRESIEDLLITMAKVNESDFARNKKRHFAAKDRDRAGKERLLASKRKYLARTERNLAEKEKDFEAKDKDFEAKDKIYLAAKEVRDLAAKYVNVVAKRNSVSAEKKHLVAEERYLAAKQERDLAAGERDSAAQEKDLAVKEKNLAANERTFAAKKEKYFANERKIAGKQAKELTALKKELAAKKNEVQARRNYLAEKESNLAEKEEEFLLVKKERGLAVQTNPDFAAKKRGVGEIIKFLVSRERDLAAKERELAAKERDFAEQEARNLEAQILAGGKSKMELEVERVSITIRDEIAKHMQVQQDYEAKVKDLQNYSRERSELQKEIHHAFSELREEISLQRAAFRRIRSGVGLLIKIDVTEETVAADDSCPICMDELSAEKVVFKVSCNHLFHARCITQWIKVQRICPYCRQKLVVMENTD